MEFVLDGLVCCKVFIGSLKALKLNFINVVGASRVIGSGV